jgi:hypothetical protein
MSTHDLPPRRLIATKTVYLWSLVFLLICAALVGPWLAHRSLAELRMSLMARLILLPALIYGHELLHLFGFCVAGGLARSQIGIRLSRRHLLLHVAPRAPVTVGRLRFAALLPGVLLGVAPLVVGLVVSSAKLVVIGAIMIAGAGGDVAIVWAVRGQPADAIADLGAEWTS